VSEPETGPNPGREELDKPRLDAEDVEREIGDSESWDEASEESPEDLPPDLPEDLPEDE
jgi:hypothetical protein